MNRLVRGSLLGSGGIKATIIKHGYILPRLFSTSSTASSSSVGRMASRRLYRILQRQCVDFRKTLPKHTSGETMFLLQPPLNPLQSGSHRILSIKTASSEEAVDGVGSRRLLVLFRDWNEDNGEVDAIDWFGLMEPVGDATNEDPSSAATYDFSDEPTLWTTVSSVQSAIRYAFRHSKISTDKETHDRQLLNKYAIRGLRTLMEQAELWRLSSVSFEKDIRVVATSKHIGSSIMGSRQLRGSSVLKNRFSYRIRIENLSDQETVQLLGRYWHIEELEDASTDADDEADVDPPIIVNAPNSGAVGQLPVLRPGEAFSYMSGCELGTARGLMKGSFYFAPVPENTPSATLENTVDAFTSPDRFEVTVNPFPLEAAITAAGSEGQASN